MRNILADSLVKI